MSQGGPITAAEALFRLVVDRPVATCMLFAAAVVFGWVSYGNLPIELMPDISYPTITVRTEYDGAAPEEVETQVSRPIEEALATLDGLVTIESRSRAERSDVVLGFDWGTDMNASSQAIRENLQVVFLPQEAERPLILRYDPSLDPFMRVALSFQEDPAGATPAATDGATDAEVALYRLRETADDVVKREIEGMEGIAAVRVKGGLEREIRVAVREEWLAARQVRVEQIEQALRAENVNIAGGSILEGDVEFLVRTLNEYRSLDDVRELRIRRDDGVMVPLTDLAVVTETHRERDVVSHLDGHEAVELEIFKEADANVVEIARRVEDRLFAPPAPPGMEAFAGAPSLSQQLPEGMTLRKLDDQAEFIGAAVDNLRSSALLGGILAIGVTFLFLRDFRSTAIIGLAIPLSVLIGFGPLYLREISLNLMSLGGLALGVGMVVDNSTVVLESIQVYRERGASRAEAAVRGTSSVAAAVVASTLTTVAVFVPIAFVEGIAGELFGDLAIAVVSSILASLAVALLLVPTLAAIEVPAPPSSRDALTAVLDPAGVVAPPVAQLREDLAWVRERWLRLVLVPYLLLRFAVQVGFRLVAAPVLVLLALTLVLGAMVAGPLVRGVAAVLDWVAGRFQWAYERQGRRYERWLALALRRPATLMTGAFAVFLLSVAATRGLGTELIPEVHQGRFTVEAAMPIGTPLRRTVVAIEEAEQIVLRHPDVAAVYATIGSDARADASADEGEHSARLRVVLTPGGDLAAREDAVMEDLRDALAAVPKLSARMTRPVMFSFRTPVEVIVHGWELDTLRDAGDRVAAELSGLEGLRDVRTSLVAGFPEVQIRYDRERLSRMNLDAATVADRVRDRIQGVEATALRRGDRRIDLRVQLDEGDRETIADLRRINVNPSLYPPIPLEAVADVTEVEGPSEIRRVDQQRAVVVGANLEGFDLGTAAADIDAALRGIDLPGDTTYLVAGQSREMERSLASLQFAFALAVFLVYVIMASTFENLVQPLVILFSVPLALIGVAGGLWVAGLPVSVVVFIGMIVLAGVVINNAIVLVDTVNRLREEGRDRVTALREAAALRLRPILITSATTVLGLVPLALGIGAASEVQRPLAITIMGGLASSTLLTLFVVPVVYAFVTGLGRGRSAASAPAAAEEGAR